MEVMVVLDKSQCTAKPFHSLGIACFFSGFFQRFVKVRMFTCIKVFVYANCSMIRTLIVLSWSQTRNICRPHERTDERK